MESVVVMTKRVVSIKNNTEIMTPIGNCWVIANNAAGILNPEKESAILPGLVNSKNIPEPPTIVNQNVVKIGAKTETQITISLIVRHCEIFLKNMPNHVT